MNSNRRQILRRITRQEGNEFLRRAGLGVIEDGGNTMYDERTVFSGGQGTDSGYTINQQNRTPDVVKPDIYINLNSFATYPFALSNTSGNNGSVQILPSNNRRTLLLVQNQDAPGGANLYVNFSSGASVHSGILLTPGEGIVFDQQVPNNSVFVFFDSVGAVPGIAIEGAPQS